MKLKTIEEIKSYAISKGGKCLSDEFPLPAKQLKFECAIGHQWEGTLDQIVNIWCVKCNRINKQKQTLEILKDYAISKGGKCLSANYIGFKENLEWECKEGHRWNASGNYVKNSKKWCPVCPEARQIRSSKYDLEYMKAEATWRGGKCLAVNRTDSGYKFLWECSKGHQWNADGNSVINQDKWCKVCSGKMAVRYKLNDLIEFANKKGGLCLSKKYFNHKTFYEWKCNEGHIWDAKWEAVKSGHWCKVCIPRPRGQRIIDNMHLLNEIALKKGGKVISDKYINFHSKMKFECAKGHQWITKPIYVLKYNSWCTICNIRGKLSLNQMQEYAINKGGLCLSSEYKNASYKLLWQCKEGHQWYSRPRIRENKWCPECAIKKRYENFGLVKQNYDKSEVQKLASNNGSILLSEVYINRVTKLEFKCNEGHLWAASLAYIKLRQYWCPICRPESEGNMYLKRLKALQQLAIDHGGICLSSEYINAKTPMKWQCEKGHIWTFVASRIKNGYWCPKCNSSPESSRSIKKLDLLKKLAINKGGVCLSVQYINCITPMEWQCEKGHIWNFTSSRIKSGSWCPECNHKTHFNYSVDVLNSLAQNNGGKFLSEKYINSKSKLKWQCGIGHVFMKTANDVKKGKWCGKCNRINGRRNLRIDIAVYQKIAIEKGGKLLSEKYINNRTKLEWQCREGHIWNSIPESIKSGCWCPICNNKKKAATLKFYSEMRAKKRI